MRYFEIAFDSIYLISVIIIGINILLKSKNKENKIFGFMAIILGAGDAFHLVPRMIANWNNDFASLTVQLGFGEMITSISMTIFYVLLYLFFKLHYHKVQNKKLDFTIYFLAIIRIILSILPANQWFSSPKSYSFSIIRNIPFLLMGIILVVLFFRENINKKDCFKNMDLAISLSFGFYLPVVVFSPFFPIIGALMMPKTLAYVWIVIMGLKNTTTLNP